MSDFLEPILLIDQVQKKEVYVLADNEDTFEGVLLTAHRIHQLFDGEWALYKSGSKNNQYEPVDKTETVGKYVEQNITTFYWKQKSAINPNQNRSPFEGSQASQWERINQRSEGTQWERVSQQRPTPTFYNNKSTDTNNKQELANVGKRAAALMIDYIILGFFVGISMFGSNLGLLSGLSVWLYFTLLESSTLKATIGKKIMGLEVVSMYDGGKLTFTEAALRSFFKLLFPFLGCLFAIFSKRSQALHDLVARTVVIDTVPRRERI